MDTKKLRQKILDLAIHGKLVPQDPNDEPASVLLERIRSEKERLIKEGKIKRSRKTTKTTGAACDKQEVPFEVPSGWVWTTLDDLAFYKKGPFGSCLTKSMFVPKSDNTYKVYEQKNAIQKNEFLGSYYISKEKYNELNGFAVQPFDIIVSCAGTIGETYVLSETPEQGIINQALMLIRLHSRCVEDFYLIYFDYILKEEAYKESKGTAIKNIPPFDVLKNFFIPLPPLSEQQRIVEEIERWFKLIEIIEQGKADLQTTIKQAKNKILELAIHGKLVPQDPNDEPASELLKRVNPKAEITCDNGHYPKLPKGWCLCKLKNISLIITGSTPSKSNSAYYGGKVPFYKPIDLDAGRFVDSSAEYLSEAGKAISRVVPIGSTAVCCIGSIGKAGYLIKEGTTNQQINCVIPSEAVDSVFLYYLCTSPLFYQELITLSSAVTISIINKSKMENIIVPLPPIEEQKRIVSKIEDLFGFIKTIEESL
jgi:type I restriction enzyme ecoAI specificity protein